MLAQRKCPCLSGDFTSEGAYVHVVLRGVHVLKPRLQRLFEVIKLNGTQYGTSSEAGST